jgi:hypothetical protein
MSRPTLHTARALALGAAIALIAPAPAPEAQVGPPPTDWRTFEGTWSATGRRETLATEGIRSAFVVRLSGAVAITAGSQDIGAGVLGEAIGYDDGAELSVGRAVWTDSRGDRIFSAFKAEPLQTGRRVTGTITGGTGRFAGVVGDYTLTWQYVVHSEDDTVQGRAVDLKGRYRRAEAQR